MRKREVTWDEWCRIWDKRPLTLDHAAAKGNVRELVLADLAQFRAMRESVTFRGWPKWAQFCDNEGEVDE